MDWQAVVAALVAQLPPGADVARCETEIRRAIGEGLYVEREDGLTEIPVLPGWSCYVRLGDYR